MITMMTMTVIFSTNTLKQEFWYFIMKVGTTTSVVFWIKHFLLLVRHCKKYENSLQYGWLISNMIFKIQVMLIIKRFEICGRSVVTLLHKTNDSKFQSMLKFLFNHPYGKIINFPFFISSNCYSLTESEWTEICSDFTKVSSYQYSNIDFK